MKPATIKKFICISLALVCVLSAVVAGTLAWQGISQHKSNEFSGVSLAQEGHGYAVLEKLDKETGESLAGAWFELYIEEEDGGSALIGRYMTGDDGKIRLQRLEAGSYCWLETSPPYGYGYDRDEDGQEIEKYPFEVEESEDGVITLVSIKIYNERQKADLAITKTVVGGEEAGADGEAPAGEGAAGEEAGAGGEESGASGETAGNGSGNDGNGNSEAGDSDASGETAGNGSGNDGNGNSETGDSGLDGTIDPGTEQDGDELDGEEPVAEEDTAPGVTGVANAPKGALFEFTIAFEGLEDGPVTVLADGIESEMAIENGKIAIELGHGQEAVIKDLPVGTHYYIEETQAGGYIGSGENVQGAIPPEGAAADFVNYYGADEPGRLIVTKTVTAVPGGSLDLEKKFRFFVTIDGEEGIIELRHGEREEFALLPGSAWSVREEGYQGEGYEASADRLYYIDEDGLAVIEFRQRNHYTLPALIEIEGVKTWDLGGEGAALPDSIRVYLMDGDVTVAETVVSPDEDGGWRYSFAVPKYRADGATEIAYAVLEAPVPGFAATYSGFDIHNAYIPPEDPEGPGNPEKPGTPDGPDLPGPKESLDNPGKAGSPGGQAAPYPASPKTGDGSDTWLWTALMLGSAFALRLLLLHRRP